MVHAYQWVSNCVIHLHYYLQTTLQTIKWLQTLLQPHYTLIQNSKVLDQVLFLIYVGLQLDWLRIADAKKIDLPTNREG